MERPAEDRRQRVRAECEQPLELISLGELERCESLALRKRPVQIGGERPQPIRRGGGIAARSDHVTEEHEGEHGQRLIEEELAVNG
jgi:hypothetical protein